MHFARKVLAHVPQSERGAVGEELREIFTVKLQQHCRVPSPSVHGTMERYRDRFKRAVEVLAQGLDEALTCLDIPGVHHKRIKSTNVLERLFREVKRRTKVVGIPERREPGQPGHGGDTQGYGRLGVQALHGHGPARGSYLSDVTLARFRRYMDMAPLSRRRRETHKNRDLTLISEYEEK